MNIKKFSSILISIVTMSTMVTCINVSANEDNTIDNSQHQIVENYPNELEKYAQELDKINQELGTECVFDFSNYSAEDLQECVSLYTNMSLDEFYTYAKENILEVEEILSDDVILTPIDDGLNETLDNNVISPYSNRCIQSWYYNGTTSGNNVRIATWVNYVNGVAYYDDTYQIDIASNNHVTTSSAYFEVTGISNVSYTVSKRSVSMKLSGIKHPIQGSSYSFSQTINFFAGESYISGAISNY